MEANKKLLIICPYPEGVAPSQRLKYEQYFDHFRQAGYDIMVAPFITRSLWKIIYKKGYFIQKAVFTSGAYIRRFLLLFKLGRFDLVYVHLWGTPFGPPFYEWLLRKGARRLIYDIDDLVYLKNTKSKAHPLVTFIKGRKKPIFLMKHANHIITCTPHLDSFVKNFNSNTTDISSTVDTEKYVPVNTYSNDKKLTLGWSGSLSTSKYFYLLENVLKRLSKEYAFNILVIGDSSVKIEGLEIEALDWNEQDEVKNLQRIDIGLYPLPDEEWVLGKSGLKAIQYMALGIPTVATAIGANHRVIEDGISGYLVKTEDEWTTRLSSLIESPAMRRQIGTTARKHIEHRFSVQKTKRIYLQILDDLVKVAK